MRALLVLLIAARVAHADDAVRELSASAAFTPGIAAADDRAGFAVATTAWDGASHATTLAARVEVPVVGPLRVVARVDDLASRDARPGAGFGVRLLDERTAGVAATAYALYKAEGFTEPAGELETTLALGRRIGAARVTLDVTYGQDLDAHERDGELAAAVLVEPVRDWFAGATAHYRDALGSPGDRGVLRDLVAGPTLTFASRFVAVTALAGIAGVTTATSRAYGATATLAIGTAF